MPFSELQNTLDAMPPVRAMQVCVRSFDGERLILSAPLAANVNDKGCAFGGSLSGVMTLAAWALVTQKLHVAGFAAEVYVADSQVRYLAPLFEDISAVAELAEAADWSEFAKVFRERGRARLRLNASIHTLSGQRVAELSGRFVAFKPSTEGIMPP